MCYKTHKIKVEIVVYITFALYLYNIKQSQKLKDMKANSILIGKRIMDSNNNIFTVISETYNLDKELDGYVLKGQSGQKEISKHDLKFYGLI